MRELVRAGQPIRESFLAWHRTRQYGTTSHTVEFRGGRHNQHHEKTFVVACRYWYELTDGYWGQLVLTQIPHLHAEDLLPKGPRHLHCMQNFVGMLEYLTSWRWGAPGCIVVAAQAPRDGVVFEAKSLPLIVNDAGSVEHLSGYEEGAPVFPTACCFPVSRDVREA